MSDTKKAKRTETTISFQEVHLIRSVEYQIGKLRLIFWHGGGEVFNGRCSHMRALRAARESAGIVTTKDRAYNEKAKA